MLLRSEEPIGKYVPQSVSAADGKTLDADVILRAAFKDGSEICVEYSDGPNAFTAPFATRHRRSLK